MTIFLLTLTLLLLVVAGMAIGAMVSGKTIKGSCGGLNAVSGADRCMVCQKPIDPDNPLREQLQCGRRRQKQIN